MNDDYFLRWRRYSMPTFTEFTLNKETKMENENRVCENCDKESEQDLVSINGIVVCEDCEAENFSNCSDCGETHHNDDITSDSDLNKELCAGCMENYIRCNDCNSRVNHCDSYSVSWHNEVCEPCYENNYFNCENCDNTFTSDEQQESGLCESCHDEKYGAIKEWNTNVLDFCEKDNDRRCFGVELEMGVNTDHHNLKQIAEETNELVKADAILKNDGSISTGDYEGFELVTRPMNFRNQVAFWEDFSAKRNKALRSYALGTCGLHIHVSKASVSPLTIGKVLVFVNSAENREFMRHIARRECKEYAKFVDKKITDARKQQRERYEAINLMPEKTIEFRMFRGSMRLETILCGLEFVECILNFAKDTSIKNLEFSDFVKFVGNQKGFKNLKARIKTFEGK